MDRADNSVWERGGVKKEEVINIAVSGVGEGREDR